MNSQTHDAPPATWDPELLASILPEISTIHTDMLRLEQQHQSRITETHESFRESARNLLHYLALRRHDVRGLQEKLALLGLSSLGRTESHALAGLEAVLKIVHHLSGRTFENPQHAPALTFEAGKALLQTHTAELLGPRLSKRGVRIMVTMPPEAASDYELVRELLAQGMEVMRINCAHDDRQAWAAMIENLRRAMHELGRKCQVLMDVAGPKLRTGPIDVRSQVVKWRPQRDLYGRVSAPVHVWLTPTEQPEPPPAPGGGSLLVQRELLDRCRSGDRLKFIDLRGKSRTLELEKHVGPNRWAACKDTVYLAAGAPCRSHIFPRLAMSSPVRPRWGHLHPRHSSSSWRPVTP